MTLYAVPDDPAEWRANGACNGVDPELFFPERGEANTVAEAKAVCATCPVRLECLEYALAAGEKFGIWGGLSERERRRIRAQRSNATRKPKPCDVCGTTFTPARITDKLCSDECRNTAKRRRHAEWDRRNRYYATAVGR